MDNKQSGCSNLTITLLLIFMWPIGLIVMWAYGAYTRGARIAITLLFAGLIAIGVIATNSAIDFFVETVEEEPMKDLDLDLFAATEKIEENAEKMAQRIEEQAERMAERIEANAEKMEARAERMAQRLEEKRLAREARRAARAEPDRPEADEAPKSPRLDTERYTLIRIMEEEIQPMRPVEFETGSHTLRPSSHAILDEVASAIEQFTITRLLIGGHTDDVGSESDNMRLSQRRADAVRIYLQDKGVTADLMAIGFGKTRPVVNASTPEARAQNRRVEFQIMQRKIVVEKETGDRGPRDD